MNFLQKLAGGVDTIPALNAILRQPELWKDNRITLREVIDSECVNWFQFDLLPQLRQFIFGLMARVEGEFLGPVKVVRVAPGTDWNASKYREEYYFLVLNAAPGVSVTANNSQSVMVNPGDVWWVAGVPYFVNNSAEEFIFLEMHIKPSGPATYAPEGV